MSLNVSPPFFMSCLAVSHLCPMSRIRPNYGSLDWRSKLEVAGVLGSPCCMFGRGVSGTNAYNVVTI